MSKLTVRIESTPPRKTLLPWVTTVRHGRQSIEAQCFALLGYPENELATLTDTALENARETLGLGIRLLNALEYIPHQENALEEFFEKKALAFERQLQENSADIPLHGAIGIVQGTRLIFCVSGDILALQISTNGITNLADISRGGALHFDTFRSGILTQQSLMLFIPKSIGTLLKSDELKTLHSAKSSERKLEYLQHLGDKRMTVPGGFRALLLQARPAIQKTTESTAVSIANLLDTEARTEDLLSPPLWRPLFLRIKNAFSLAASENTSGPTAATPETRGISRPRPKPPSAKPRIPFLAHGSSLSTGLMRISARGRQWLRLSKKFDHPAASLSRRGKNWYNQIKTLRDRPNITALLARFNMLPRKSKLLLLGVLFLLFIALESILLTGRHRNIAQADGQIQDEIAAIRTLLNSASASLIYNDEATARSQTAEAAARLNALPEFTKSVAHNLSISAWDGVVKTTASPEIKELGEAVQTAQEKLRHAVIIDAPSPVADSLRATLGLQDTPTLALLFHKRKYELRPAENQISKHEPTADGFDVGVPWIKDSTEVRNGISLTIDGTLYVGQADGGVTALRKGKKFNFVLQPIDPPLTALKKIWTNEESDYFYVLDPAQKRLLAFTKKDGILKAQYTSPRFSALQDFSVDERAKLAYLLDGSRVISIPLSHFSK